MYEAYMKDPETPDAVKRTKKAIVLRLLENRAVDRYEAIATNACASWRFGGLEDLGSLEGLAVRMRFTNQYEMRQDIRGTFTLGDYQGVVSNITQAVLTIPLTFKTSQTFQTSQTYFHHVIESAAYPPIAGKHRALGHRRVNCRVRIDPDKLPATGDVCGSDGRGKIGVVRRRSRTKDVRFQCRTRTTT